MFKLTSQLISRPLLRSIISKDTYPRLASSASHSDKATTKEDIKQNDSITQGNQEEGRLDDLYRYLWIRCSGHEVQVLDSYETFLKAAAKHLHIDYVETQEPWRTIKKRTLLASRFVRKKYRVQYETRSYNRNLLFKNLTGSTADTFLEYVQRNVPEGVMFIAEKHRLAQLPFDLEYTHQDGEEVKEDR